MSDTTRLGKDGAGPGARGWRAVDDLCPFCLRLGVQARIRRSAYPSGSEERHCTRCRRVWWVNNVFA
jgi:hypothetical protein